MRYSVFLQAPFDFERFWLLLGIGLILAAGLAWLAIRHLRKKGIRLDRLIALLPAKRRLSLLRRRYLRRVERIGSQFSSGDLDCRAAHQALSREVRLFAQAVTGQPMIHMVHSELKQTRYQALANLVGEMYVPEFARLSAADVEQMIRKSKELISLWQ